MATVMNPHLFNDVFLNALKNKKVLNIVKQCASGKVLGLQTRFFYCPPGTSGYSMHQDNYFAEQKKRGSFRYGRLLLM